MTWEGETATARIKCCRGRRQSDFWHRLGRAGLYSPALPEAVENEVIRSGLKSTLIETMRKFTSVNESTFTLEKYHDFVDNDLHSKITGELRGGFRVASFPGGISRVEERVSQVCCVELTSTCPSVGWGGYFIRIVRPNLKTDNNPPHRDVWLAILRSCVNIYFPLAGSDQRSALPIVPGSHLWRESDIERTAKGARGRHSHLSDYSGRGLEEITDARTPESAKRRSNGIYPLRNSWRWY